MGAGSKLAHLRTEMEKARVDGFLVTSFLNWRYLSGFAGDAGMLLITPKSAYLFTDSRYTEAASEEAPDFQVVETSFDRDHVLEALRDEGVGTLAFEKEYVTYSLYERLSERFSGIGLSGVSGWIEELRMRKSPQEIAYIEKAQNIADLAFGQLTDSIRVGATEADLALDFEFRMRRLGAEGLSFPIIAVSGARSSLPHGRPTEKKLEVGDFVTFDFGAKYEGYCSDETRTYVMGELSPKHKEIYDIVLEAQLAGLDAVKPGVLGKDVDGAARKVIDDAGYGEYFGHGTGHGVGLNVHEGPGVGKRSETRLEPGMVVTVEPGIYIPGFGGCRIEDLVLVTREGKRILSTSPKDLTVLGQ